MSCSTCGQVCNIAQPQDGPVLYTDRADIAEATAVVLADDPSIDGPITLTAPTAVTFDDLAKIASDLTDRAVKRIVLDDDQWVADQVTIGVPEQMARRVLTWYQAARTGHFAETDPLLTALLGREPRTAADRLAARIAT